MKMAISEFFRSRNYFTLFKIPSYIQVFQDHAWEFSMLMKELSALFAPQLLPQPCLSCPFLRSDHQTLSLNSAITRPSEKRGFSSPLVTWEQKPLGASLIGLATKDQASPRPYCSTSKLKGTAIDRRSEW